MTNKQVSEYIYRGDIPMSFIWEDDNEYFFLINCGQKMTSSTTKKYNVLKYPKWTHKDKITPFNRIFYFKESNLFEDIFESYKSTMEEVLSDFMFWWEINKGRCKSITYYQS